MCVCAYGDGGAVWFCGRGWVWMQVSTWVYGCVDARTGVLIKLSFVLFMYIGVGAVIFALPKLMIGSYSSPIYDNQIKLNICAPNKISSPDTCQVKFSGDTILHIMMFMLGQIIMGAGTTPHYTLGIIALISYSILLFSKILYVLGPQSGRINFTRARVDHLTNDH